jgi:aspartate aminotransferase
VSAARAGKSLAGRAARIEVSPTVAVSQQAAALKAAGVRVLDFSVGEPDQPTPEHVRAAAEAALLAGRTRYTPAAGLPELRQAIVHRYVQDFGVDFAASEAVAASGGKHGLYVLGQVLLERGDEAVIPTPHWPTFAEVVRLAGARPVLLETREEEGFRVSARRLARLVTPRTKLVMLCSPANPTGALVPPEETLALARMAQRRGFYLLYDDTYARLLYDALPIPIGPFREAAPDRFLLLGTASKSYCMTGWRVGWVLGPRPVIDACAAVISHSTQCPATFAQLGAVAALEGPQGFVRDLAEAYRARRDAVMRILASVPGLRCHRPEGAFFVFPNVERFLSPELPDTLALAARLLEEEQVAVVPGEGFGAPGFLRLSYAAALPDLTEGAGRLAAFLARRAMAAAAPAASRRTRRRGR